VSHSNYCELGRDDLRELHPYPNHALRVLEDLSAYELPLSYPRAIVDLVVNLLRDPAETNEHARSPLELLRPLLKREDTTTRAAGFGFQFGSYVIDARATKKLREEIRSILVDQAHWRSLRNRVLAAKLLGESLHQPHGFFGQTIENAALDQWHDDQRAIVQAIRTLVEETDDPHVRFELRDALEWHQDHSRWPDIAEEARVIRSSPLTDREGLVRVLREPFNWRNPDDSLGHVRSFAEQLVSEGGEAEGLAERLNAELRELENLPEARPPNAGPLLSAIAEDDSKLAAGLATWCAQNSQEPLARFGDALLSVLRTGDPESLRGLIETLRSGDTTARRQLASYIASGRWFHDLGGPEPAILRDLVADEDSHIVRTALLAVLRLADSQPELAIDIALGADVRANSVLADELCMALSRVVDRLTERQVVHLLEKLGPVPELEYWPHEVLGKLAPLHRGAVLGFLLARARAGGEVRATSIADYDVDLLGGAKGDELRDLLREVRDAAVGAAPSVLWELQHLYWRLTDELDAKLDVLREWFVAGSSEQVATAAELLGGMPWETVLVRPDFVSDVLTAACGHGAAVEREVGSALFVAAAVSGAHHRTMGQPSPRDVRLRDQGRRLAGQFPTSSPAHRFFMELARRAEENIRRDELEDEEFTELRD
jgi:hypothetical protein